MSFLTFWCNPCSRRKPLPLTSFMRMGEEEQIQTFKPLAFSGLKVLTKVLLSKTIKLIHQGKI